MRLHVLYLITCLQVCAGLFVCTAAISQRTVPPTSAFTVSGEIASELIVSTHDLEAFTTHTIGDFIVTNHKGEQKSIERDVRGVLLTDVLSQLKFQVEKPNELRAFYFVFKASDGYAVVFSWNELFNGPTGEHTFLVTHMNGKPVDQLDERILCITTSDYQTGRRHIKGLQEIVVKRADRN